MSVGLNLKRYQSSHFQPTSRDCYKPNFIFSSDIVEKVGRLTREYESLRTETDRERDRDTQRDRDTDTERDSVGNADSDGAGETSFDLCDGSEIEFSVNVELNILLNRNNGLRPSDLIKDNLVFLAKTNDTQRTCTSGLLSVVFKEDKLTIHPRHIVTNEVFIVTLRLKVLNFIVDGTTVTIDFLKDENYGILLLCDYSFITHIERYIGNLFTHQLLANSLETDKDAVGYSTIPSGVPSGVFQEDEINLSQDISGTETTLEFSEHEVTDTIDCSDISYSKEDDVDTLVGRTDDLLKSVHKSKNSTRIPNIPEEEDNFIGNMNNLRHNDEKEDIRHKYAEPEEKMGERSQLQQDIDAHEQSLRELQELPHLPPFGHDGFIKPIDIKPRTLSSSSTFKSPALKSSTSRPDLTPDLTSPIEFPRIKLKHSNPFLNAPTPPSSTEEIPPLSRKSSKGIQPPKPIKKSPSYSLDLHEFENFTPSATYVKGVKGDKKFKFIQVGKVQKFVNLFEERVNEETEPSRGSTRGSTRASTRASSPVRPSSPVKTTRPSSPVKTSAVKTSPVKAN